MRIRTLCVGLIGAAMLLGQSPESPEARTRQVLQLFLEKQYEAIYEMFSPEMQKAITLEAYKEQLGQIQSLGRPARIGEPVVQQAGSIAVVTITVEWPVFLCDFRTSWGADGKIVGSWVRPHAAPWVRPSYSKPGSFAEREITIGADEWQLPGTLTTPVGKGPFAAVVLVHGSGPNDRDESVGGVKVFRDLAEGLASRGVAVLRYEKRTRVYGARCAALPKLTINEETVEDAVRAAALARTLPQIDPGRVFVLGHSQGGYMAARIGRRDPKLAGLVGLAGNVRPLDELLREQIEYMNGLQGKPANTGPAPSLGLPEAYMADLKGYDPARDASTLRIPMLILQGERDYQVSMKDFALWKAALGRRKDVTMRSYPALNHLFVAGEGKSCPAEYQKGGHVAEDVIADIAAWTSAHRAQ